MAEANKKVKKLSNQQKYAKKMTDNDYICLKRWVHKDDIEEFDKIVNSLPGRKYMNIK